MKLSELASKVGAKFVGEGEIEVRGVATLDEAGPTDVSFLANPKYADRLGRTKAAVVCVADGAHPPSENPKLNLIVSNDPYYTFCKAVVVLVGHRKHPFVGVHALAYVDPSASVGENTTIYPFAFVGPRARIGGGCVLYPGACVYDDCVVGDRVTIHANAVIGQDGFGYATHNGEHHKIPQAGNVVIEDDVEIGSCCAIERATLGSTVIGRGTKFADLIGIGHGTKIGHHGLLVSQVGIAGSTIVGDWVTFGGQVGVAGHLKIGSKVKIGAQSGVMDDVPDGTDVLGSPAVPIRDARRVYAGMFQLPELMRRMRELESQLDELRSRLPSSGSEGQV
jgi:UDP-3-O-[3-hydroxymyristoyl] glucosamine N-acyltransferase